MEAKAEAARLQMEASQERRDAAWARLHVSCASPERLAQVQAEEIARIRAELDEARQRETKSKDALEAVRGK